jgi:hypothetical protein
MECKLYGQHNLEWEVSAQAARQAACLPAGEAQQIGWKIREKHSPPTAWTCRGRSLKAGDIAIVCGTACEGVLTKRQGGWGHPLPRDNGSEDVDCSSTLLGYLHMTMKHVWQAHRNMLP